MAKISKVLICLLGPLRSHILAVAIRLPYNFKYFLHHHVLFHRDLATVMYNIHAHFLQLFYILKASQASLFSLWKMLIGGMGESSIRNYKLFIVTLVCSLGLKYTVFLFINIWPVNPWWRKCKMNIII